MKSTNSVLEFWFQFVKLQFTQCSAIFQENITAFIKRNESVSTREDAQLQWFLNSVHIIRWCYVPFMFIGTITNVINIIIFSKPKMRSLSTGNFLLALAFADIGTIYFQVRIFSQFLVHILTSRTWSYLTKNVFVFLFTQGQNCNRPGTCHQLNRRQKLTSNVICRFLNSLKFR